MECRVGGIGSEAGAEFKMMRNGSEMLREVSLERTRLNEND